MDSRLVQKSKRGTRRPPVCIVYNQPKGRLSEVEVVQVRDVHPGELNEQVGCSVEQLRA